MKNARVGRQAVVALVVMVIVGSIFCLLTLCKPALGTSVGCFQSLFFEHRWLTRDEYVFAKLPLTALEVAPGHPTWGDVGAEYYFSSGSSTGEELQTRFVQSDTELNLASMTEIAGTGSVTYAHAALGDEVYVIVPDEKCRPVDIAWANDEGQCTCSIDGGACLTWWTDEGGYVIVSKSMDVKTLEKFANSLTPVGR